VDKKTELIMSSARNFMSSKSLKYESTDLCPNESLNMLLTYALKKIIVPIE